MAKKKITQAKCNECKYSIPFSDRVITCSEKKINLVGNSIRICHLFKNNKS